MSHRTVSLVLGSGGARGLAHIGVIHWLSRHGFEIRSIAGSSMGALVGGIYAAGELEVFERWVSVLQKADVLRLLDISIPYRGLIKGDRIVTVLRDLIGERNIQDLPLAFTAVATDLNAQKEIWLNRGPLFHAIRASIAIPSLLTPHEYLGRTLADGGIINPLPIAPTLNDHTDMTIAVYLGAKPDPEFSGRTETPTPRNSGYQRRIAGFIDGLQNRLGPTSSGEMNILDVLTKANETMQNAIARLKLAAYSPDAIVEIPRNVCTFYEFYRAGEIIEIGHLRAAQALGPLLQPGA